MIEEYCTKVAQLHARMCSCALFLAPTTMSRHSEDMVVLRARNGICTTHIKTSFVSTFYSDICRKPEWLQHAKSFRI